MPHTLVQQIASATFDLKESRYVSRLTRNRSGILVSTVSQLEKIQKRFYEVTL